MCACSVRNGSASRRRRGHRTRDSVDGVASAELFYGDLGGSSGAADYRAVGLSDFRRVAAAGGTGSAAVGGSGADSGCASCLSCDPASGGKQRTVVCTVQNTRTATLVHRLDDGTTCQYGYATNGTATGQIDGQPRTAGRASTAYAGKRELYCHSPYCIYASTGTSRRLQTFKNQPVNAAAAPDVAAYSSGSKARWPEEAGGPEFDAVEDAVRVDRAAEPVDDDAAMDGAQIAEVGQSSAAERWLRGDREEGARADPRAMMEPQSRRPSDSSSLHAPSPTSRPAADVLDILGLADPPPPPPPVATPADSRRVLDGLYNDYIINNNYNSSSSGGNNNNSIIS